MQALNRIEMFGNIAYILYKYDNAVIPFMGCKDPTWLIDAYKEGLK